MAYAFFAAANTKDGFVSLFPTLPGEGRRLYALKGGPGCGKSTLLARLADRLGGADEVLYCSSDPDSLDGALLPGLALVDGTAPHVQDPNLPGCDGEYLPLPPLKDTPALAQKAPALYALQSAVKAHYADAYRHLRAAAAVRESRRESLRALLTRDPLTRLPALLREIPRASGAGQLRQRFLDGITPQGQLCLWQTAAQFDRVIALEDNCGLCAPLLDGLLKGALERGQLVYGCYDPLEPRRLRHLLLPQCSLAFVTRRQELPFAPARTVHPLAALDREGLRLARPHLRRKERLEEELLADGVSAIAAAHRLHDQMEDVYRPHLDTDALDQWVEVLLGRMVP